MENEIIKVEVGNTYYTNGGEEYTIIAQKEPDVFVDETGKAWTKDGYFLSCYEENPFYDLVGKVEVDC